MQSKIILKKEGKVVCIGPNYPCLISINFINFVFVWSVYGTDLIEIQIVKIYELYVPKTCNSFISHLFSFQINFIVIDYGLSLKISMRHIDTFFVY